MCAACAADRHAWGPVPEPKVLRHRYGGWVRLDRFSCTCSICRMRCTAREVRIGAWEEDPTMQFPLVEATDAPPLPAREPGTHLYEEHRMNQPPNPLGRGMYLGPAPEVLKRVIDGLSDLSDDEPGD